MSALTDGLDGLVERLEQAAAALRSGELSGEQAAATIEQCAQLAGNASSELDRLARIDRPPAPGADPESDGLRPSG